MLRLQRLLYTIVTNHCAALFKRTIGVPRFHLLHDGFHCGQPIHRQVAVLGSWSWSIHKIASYDLQRENGKQLWSWCPQSGIRMSCRDRDSSRPRSKARIACLRRVVEPLIASGDCSLTRTCHTLCEASGSRSAKLGTTPRSVVTAQGRCSSMWRFWRSVDIH